MKYKNFLPMICLAFVALLTSCEKSETPIVEEDLNGFRIPVPEPTEKIPISFDDQNQVQIEGLLVKQGDRIPWAEIKEKAPDFYQEHVASKSNHSRTILDTMQQWSVNWTWSQQCTCGPEYCPKLGAEVQGQKNGSWIQVANRPASAWWKQMSYIDDVKDLTKFSNGRNQYRHINYNAKGTLVVTLFYSDSVQQEGVFVDIDGPITVGDYGNYTWCSVYHDQKIFTAPDENGITSFYTSCGSCDPCP